MEDLSGKRLAFLGTDAAAQEAAEYCRRHGITVVSFGNRPDARVHRFSDEQCIVNCTDAEVMIPLLKEKKIDGVLLSESDRVNRKCIQYLPETGLRSYATLRQWDALMNKAEFKRHAGEFGIRTVPEYPIDAEKETIPENIGYPVVIKPPDNCGAYGVSICRTPEEAEQAIREAKAQSPSGAVLCEKFLTGEQFSFEMWMQNGKAYFPFVKQKIPYPGIGLHPIQTFLDVSPASFSEKIGEYFYSGLEKLFLSLGIYNGQCFFQGILENGVPYIMDVGFRLSGGLNWMAIKEEKGADLIGSYIQFALSGKFGGDFSTLNDPYENSYAFVCIGLKNGRIGRIRGMDEIENMPCVVNVYRYYDEGDTISTSGMISQTLCRILVKAGDRAGLKTSVAQVLSCIEVLDTEGKSMLREYPEKYYDRLRA